MDLMSDPVIEGCGETVELRLEGDRLTRPGRPAGELERYTVTIQLPRFMVRRLLDQIRGMHDRDLERIEREKKRRQTEALLLSQDFKQ